MIKIIKGATAKDLIKIERETDIIDGSLKVIIGDLPPFVYKNPIFPILISLSKEQTINLKYENEIIVSEIIGEDEIIYSGKSIIYAYDAPTEICEKDEESNSIILNNCQNQETIILSFNKYTKIYQGNGVVVEEKEDGYEINGILIKYSLDADLIDNCEYKIGEQFFDINIVNSVGFGIINFIARENINFLLPLGQDWAIGTNKEFIKDHQYDVVYKDGTWYSAGRSL